MGVKYLWVVFVFLVLLLGFGLAGSAFLPDTGNESNGLLIAIAGVAIAGGILVLKRKDPIAKYIETQMEVIEKQNLSAAWVDAERLKEFIEELKQTPGWERYRGLIGDAERLISGVEKAYHRWRLEIKKEQVRETIRSPSPFDDLALYFSTGMLSWEDPFDIVSWGHAIAGNIDLESKEQAFENIVRIKAEQMLELEDNMGTIEHSKPLGILKQGLMSPFTATAGAAVAGELGIGARIESFLSKHELLATGLKAGDYAFNAMYVGSVINDLREGNYEGVIRDIGFIGLVGGVQKTTKLLETANNRYISAKVIRELYGNKALQKIVIKKNYLETYIDDTRLLSAFNSRGASMIAKRISKETGWPYNDILANLDTLGVYWEYETKLGILRKNIILREDLIKIEPGKSFYSKLAKNGDFVAKYTEVLTHEMYHKLIHDGSIVIPDEYITIARKKLGPNAPMDMILEEAEEMYIDFLMEIKFGGML